MDHGDLETYLNQLTKAQLKQLVHDFHGSKDIPTTKKALISRLVQQPLTDLRKKIRVASPASKKHPRYLPGKKPARVAKQRGGSDEDEITDWFAFNQEDNGNGELIQLRELRDRISERPSGQSAALQQELGQLENARQHSSRVCHRCHECRAPTTDLYIPALKDLTDPQLNQLNREVNEALLNCSACADCLQKCNKEGGCDQVPSEQIIKENVLLYGSFLYALIQEKYERKHIDYKMLVAFERELADLYRLTAE